MPLCLVMLCSTKLCQVDTSSADILCLFDKPHRLFGTLSMLLRLDISSALPNSACNVTAHCGECCRNLQRIMGAMHLVTQIRIFTILFKRQDCFDCLEKALSRILDINEAFSH